MSVRVRKNNLSVIGHLFAILASAILLSGCGTETFEQPEIAQTVTANQFITIKPKVDIILFQDISGSMIGPANVFRSQMSSFLQNLNSDWDLHLAVLPLQFDPSNITHRLDNRYVIANDCSKINSPYCLSTSAAANVISNNGAVDDGLFYAANPSVGNTDYGFNNMQAQLQSLLYVDNVGFLRDDAMIVVIPFTNGNDISGATASDITYRVDGQPIINYNSSNLTRTFNEFYSFLTRTLKPTASLLNFFSVAAQGSANQIIPNCQGSSAEAGTRYNSMASRVNSANPAVVNGASYNICGSGLSSVLSNIADRLQNIIITVEFNFIAIPVQPEPSSIRIIKNGVEIPANNSTNGWTLFLGSNGQHSFETNFPTSFAPAIGNERDGFMIELHGSARYSGADVLEVIYEEKLIR